MAEKGVEEQVLAMERLQFGSTAHQIKKTVLWWAALSRPNKK